MPSCLQIRPAHPLSVITVSTRSTSTSGMAASKGARKSLVSRTLERCRSGLNSGAASRRRRWRRGASRCTWARSGSGSWCAPTAPTTRSPAASSTTTSRSTATRRRGPSRCPAPSTPSSTYSGTWTTTSTMTTTARSPRRRRRRFAAYSAAAAGTSRSGLRGTGCSARPSPRRRPSSSRRRRLAVGGEL
ncbi:hypothetical protein ACQJBY_024779 [Aegilops geniculata]